MSGLRRLLIPLASAGAVRSGPESLLVFSLGGGMCVCNMTWSRRVRVAWAVSQDLAGSCLTSEMYLWVPKFPILYSLPRLLYIGSFSSSHCFFSSAPVTKSSSHRCVIIFISRALVVRRLRAEPAWGQRNDRTPPLRLQVTGSCSLVKQASFSDSVFPAHLWQGLPTLRQVAHLNQRVRNRPCGCCSHQVMIFWVLSAWSKVDISSSSKVYRWAQLTPSLGGFKDTASPSPRWAPCSCCP